MKKCTTCKEEKPFTEFHKCKVSKDGYNIYCKVCMNAKTRAWKQKNKDKIAEYNREYYIKDVPYQVEKARKWQKNNPERYAVLYRKISKRYATKNKDKKAAAAALRRGIERKSTPVWLTKEHKEEIRDFFTISKMFTIYSGQIYHVDHIIPLNSKVVCGLNVPWNLQIITASENLRKANKLLECFAEY